MNGRTSQEAALMVGNKFDLVLIASARVRELKNGHKPKIISTDSDIITALNEIEQGHVGREYLNKVR